MSKLARTPKPPYYAVIFTSLRTSGDNGYVELADEMLELAKLQPGFLGIESARDGDGIGITVSYWDSEESIRAWKENGRHRVAQKLGREKWYERFATRVCKVERAYGFTSAPSEETGE
ncbi:antibiotic biosynthesis monooxygenase family protein [Alicyclobacillus sp. ALC3]|uniref:antibiotic biosynthesis monooxygenase family protein n=1 Tax=Alicyclobacillus sp. ALC3 TaxID=2796143 RepID=UPI0023795992|nr:antibiotic biosynthesis monooxygenase [Alicyclobacillus sp. ALC3]WDL96682.1 antibiotic biosynthesis monooxygenase [Alicyclobacillus sp. ALC3]